MPFNFFTPSTTSHCRSINLIKTAVLQIFHYDHVGGCVEYKLDVVGVGGTSHVAVDFFGRRFVLGLELCLNVRCRLTVLLRTFTN